MTKLRERLTLPLALSGLALFFALAGTGIAARHYLITSTRQVSPRVLRQLQGRSGSPGRDGASAGLVSTLSGNLALTNSNEPQPVVSITNVPAGAYVVNASTELNDTGTEGVSVRCEIAATLGPGPVHVGAETGQSQVLIEPIEPEPKKPQHEEGSTAVTGAVRLASPGNLQLLCNVFGTAGIQARNAAITAVQVQRLG